MSWVNTASIRWTRMKSNVASNYCYLWVTLSHDCHPIDENGYTLAQSVSPFEGLPSFGWKPMKSKMLINGTVGGLHRSDVSRWNLCRPLNRSFVTYTLVKLQYLFFGLSHSTNRIVWNEIIGGNIAIRCFQMKMCSRSFLILLVSSLQRALVVA